MWILVDVHFLKNFTFFNKINLYKSFKSTANLRINRIKEQQLLAWIIRPNGT